MRLRKDDRVVSLGDQWMVAGSEGIVREAGQPASIMVFWDKAKVATKVNVCFFHRSDRLRLIDDGKIDPNREFMRRKNE